MVESSLFNAPPKIIYLYIGACLTNAPSILIFILYMVHNVIIVSETVHGIDSMYGAILVNVCD